MIEAASTSVNFTRLHGATTEKAAIFTFRDVDRKRAGLTKVAFSKSVCAPEANAALVTKSP
jgi:hypothetical protein